METKEYIILITFEDLTEGITFVNSFITPFSFYYNGETYNSNGDIITTPDNPSFFNKNEIYIDIYENPQEGQLYVGDGFLKYYKQVI